MEEDKKKHMIVAFFGTIATFIVTRNVWITAAVAIGIGLLKEFYDVCTGGAYSILDMSANAVGIFSAVLLIIGFLEIAGKDW